MLKGQGGRWLPRGEGGGPAAPDPPCCPKGLELPPTAHLKRTCRDCTSSSVPRDWIPATRLMAGCCASPGPCGRVVCPSPQLPFTRPARSFPRLGVLQCLHPPSLLHVHAHTSAHTCMHRVEPSGPGHHIVNVITTAGHSLNDRTNSNPIGM